MEAITGFEPVIKVLQTFALPLGYTAVHFVIRNTLSIKTDWFNIVLDTDINGLVDSF